MVPVFVVLVAGVVVSNGVGPENVITRPVTVNALVSVALPLGVVTVTFLAVSAAVVEIMKFAVIVVEFATVTALTVMFAPDTATVVPVAVKLVPVKVT